MAPFCHARVSLSGIHVFIIPGFPPEDCGNDMVMGNAGWLPSVMPEVFCRASMLLFFLDSRQKIAGMTEGALDSRQKIAGMTDGALDSGFHRNDE